MSTLPNEFRESCDAVSRFEIRAENRRFLPGDPGFVLRAQDYKNNPKDVVRLVCVQEIIAGRIFYGFERVGYLGCFLSVAEDR
jgi:hypothetical protein